MVNSTSLPVESCTVVERFDLNTITAVAGANLLFDFIRDSLHLRSYFGELTFSKAPWATYTLADELEVLICAYMLGYKRISHIEEVESDPLFCKKVGLQKLPDTTTLYRALERFGSADRVGELSKANQHVLSYLLAGLKTAILDIDTTVETVHGQQEGSCIGYNARYHGRASYQPLLAFEGQSHAAVHTSLRSGATPSADEIIAFYKEAKSQLPVGVKLAFVRGDRGMTSEKMCAQLERDHVSYTLKLKMPKTLYKRIGRGVLWSRLPNDDDTVVIEVGSVKYKADSWSTHRRVVLVRSRPAFEQQQALFAEYSWHYEAIVTDLDWDPEDVWHFYNQRCSCENYIKELKYGVNVDAIGKENFWPNAADLWFKVIAYNAMLALRDIAPTPYRCYGSERFRRAFLRVPGVLVYHARQWILRLPAYWPHAAAWKAIRLTLSSP